MEKRKMAAIFFGASMLLLGVYIFANRGAGAVQIAEKQKQDLFSAEGSATLGQDAGANEGWGDMLSRVVGKDSPEDRNNVTKNIARVAFEQMRTLDQQGKSPFDDANINTQSVQASIENSIDRSLDSFYGSAVVTSNREIKISANNTKAAKVAYLKSIGAILTRHQLKEEYKNALRDVQELVESSCKDGDTAGINKGVADFYAALGRDFIATRVPSAWVNFHKEAIEHYKKGDLVFTAIANCTNDPLKGIVGAQKLSTFMMDSMTLQNMLKKMYTEVGL